MPFPTWRKRLQTLLTSADWFRGKRAQAALAATITVAATPPTTLPGPTDQAAQEGTSDVTVQRVPKRIIRGFILARGPHKSVNPDKPTGTDTGVAATPATAAAPVKPAGPPRPAGGGHASHASHASHSSHRSHSSAGWA